MSNWSIKLAEYPSQFGREDNKELFGKPFSHPFLYISDENGDVVEEIHGRWKNTIRSRQFVDLEEQYIDMTQRKKSAVFPVLYPTAVVSACGLRHVPIATHTQPVFKGRRGDVEYLVQLLKSNIPIVNEAHTPFFRYAVPNSGFANCQMSLSMIIDMTDDFPPVPDLMLAYTGWTRPFNAVTRIAS